MNKRDAIMRLVLYRVIAKKWDFRLFDTVDTSVYKVALAKLIY